MAESKLHKEHTFLVFAEDEASVSLFREIDWASLDLKANIRKGPLNDAVEFLKKNDSPDYLVIDLSSSKLPISDMQKVAQVCDPGINVIALGTRNEVGLFRDLMTLGVRDYITKPLNVALIKKTIQRVVKGLEDQTQLNFLNPGQSVGFIGVSGGAGCSTLAANTAACFSTVYEKSVVLADLGLRFSGSTKLFNVALKAGFRELLESDEPVNSTLVHRSLTKVNENLHVIGGDEPVDAHIELNQQSFLEFNKHLKSEFQYVFYDIPFVEKFILKPWFLSAFNTIVVVATPTMFQIRDAVRLISHFKKHADPNHRIILVQNLVGMHKNGEIDQESFEKAVSRKIDQIIQYDPHVVLEAMNIGVPAFEKKGKFASEIDRLSRQILGNHSEASHNLFHNSQSFLGKVFNKLLLKS